MPSSFGLPDTGERVRSHLIAQVSPTDHPLWVTTWLTARGTLTR
ncbi:hypothetical protein [Streptomyces sp. F001]|nr:hypothetical protein [Streptomyces sp. F001]